MVFYRCEECGNFVTFIGDKVACVPTCCGSKMVEVAPNTVDAATEKHVPVVSVDGNEVTVRVGSVDHPMAEEHHIAFIVLETCCGYQMKYLKVGAEPVAKFVLPEGEKAVAAYEYCNLHGLWKAEI